MAIFTIIIAFSTFTSCSNDNNKINEEENLMRNLRTYNISNENSSFSTSKKCVGFWNCLGYVAQVAGADIIGAGTGVVVVKEAAAALGAVSGGTGAVVLMVGSGVICGAGASYAAARTADTDYTKPNVEYGNLQIEIPAEFSSFENIGIRHNNVIHNNFFNGESIENFYNTFTNEERHILKSELVINANEKLKLASANYVSSNFDYKTLTQKMVNEGYYTINMKLVSDLFLERYFECSENIDMENTINFYIDQVSKSNLTETEKQALIASFIVASQSPYYLLDTK
ncbi:hypothetical protein [Flavobacterium sp.]|uniref:hypothetical protein n=1 Tax=Flavobacterium sp. TaxID=239 RepID=UPI003750E075